MNEADLKRMLEILTERRNALRAESDMGKESRKPVELDQTTQGRLSRMDAMQNQAMAQATERRRMAEIKRIDEAFARVDEDEYGYCLECGDEIAVKRLEINPSASLCINCAGQAG